MTNTRAKTKRFSRRLILFTVLFSVLFGVSLTLINYNIQVKIYEEKELTKLKAIVNTLSLSIDGEQLRQLMKDYPGKDAIKRNFDDSTYQQIQRELHMAVEANQLATNIYTMMLDSSKMQFCFGVTSAEEPYWKHVYSKFPAVLKHDYATGGVIPPYEDENGYWLSAFSPIRDMDGNIVSVIQADEYFSDFIMQARRSAIRNSIWSFLVAAIIAVFMIVTVRSIARKQEKLDEELRDLEAMRKELIANVSHDLRTPLAYIQGYLETLLMKKDDLDEERFTKYLQTSLDGTERLKNLVDELFELSRIESGSRKLNREPVVLAELVSDVVNQFKLQAADKRIDLVMDVPKELPSVSADLALLDRIFQNLISNSLKFCERGDSITVSARKDHESNGIYISISDTGPGIAEEDLPMIFDRFQRGDQMHKKGTGLGLAIVKSILDLHQCRYGIESKERKGTTFYFVLPGA